MLTNENIERIVRNVCKGKCDVDCTRSLTTRSLYFAITNGTIECWFRISDHKANTRIKTIVVSEHTKADAIERFVKNRIEFLSVLTLDSLLGITRGRMPQCAYGV